MTARRIIRYLAPTALIVGVAAGCNDDGTTTQTSIPRNTLTTLTTSTTTQPGGGGPRPRTAPYVEFDSCDSLLGWAKEEMLARVTPWGLDAGYWGWPVDGRIVEMEASDTTAAASEPAATTPSAGDAAATAAGDEQTSGTNTHEAGVDEGDISETDGRFVYSIADGRLRSVDLDAASLVATITAPAGVTDMILFGNRLMLVGTNWNGAGETVVTTYAVDGGALTEIGSTHLEGTLVSVRSIDGVARIVLTQPFGAKLPFVQPRTGGSSEEDSAREQNEQVINDATVEDLLPRLFTVGSNGGSSDPAQAIDCSQVGHPAEYSGLSTVWVATVDLTGTDQPVIGSAGVIAEAQTVYSSAEHLYVATIAFNDDSDGDVVPVNPEPLHTAIHSFSLAAPDGADYEASGEVDGTVLNQYALSEYGGYLRVATTTDSGGFGDSRESGVHVFQAQGDQLVEVGSVGGLGLGESIQGVRFIENQGYVVTFLQTDPLYVIDLSDPTNPQLRGELKVPGFSTYLHPIGNGRLLAIGMAGTESGQITGTQLSLFDVNDPANPTLIDTFDLGSWWSEATFDPHAFLYWPETGTVVVPTDDYDCYGIPQPMPVEDGPTVETKPAVAEPLDCTAAVVAIVQGDEIVAQGELPGDGAIRRSMVANGRLVTLSGTGVVIYDLATLGLTAEIPFA